MKNNNKQLGFTVVEVLIVITAVSLLAGIATISLSKGKQGGQVSGESEKMMQLIREIQNKSLIAEDGKAWGLQCDDSDVETFSYIPLNVTETYQLPDRFTCNTTSNGIRFEKLTGISQDDDLMIVEDGVDVARIEVRAPGTITLIKL